MKDNFHVNLQYNWNSIPPSPPNQFASYFYHNASVYVCVRYVCRITLMTAEKKALDKSPAAIPFFFFSEIGRINWNRQLIPAPKPYTVHSSYCHLIFHFILQIFIFGTITSQTEYRIPWLSAIEFDFQREFKLLLLLGWLSSFIWNQILSFNYIFIISKWPMNYMIIFIVFPRRARTNRTKFYDWQFQIGDQFQPKKKKKYPSVKIAWFLNLLKMIFIKIDIDGTQVNFIHSSGANSKVLFFKNDFFLQEKKITNSKYINVQSSIIHRNWGNRMEPE